VCNYDGATYSFYLDPYFHQTVAFYAICGLVLLFLGTGIYNVRVRHLRVQHQQLEELVKERTRQLEVSNAELEEANQKLEQLATRDGLTGIANRRCFDEVFRREWRRAWRNELPISLLMIDVDWFKAYNDTYGHLEGDECLKIVASILNRAAGRPADVVARFGGEEFVVLLPDTPAPGALALGEKARELVQAQHLSNPGSPGHDGHLTVSVGVATIVPNNKLSPERFVSLADRALYKAKEAGRNCVVVAQV